MPDSHLSQTVDGWTAQAVAASRYLVRLYRALGDGRQAAAALQGCGACEERQQRLGLQGLSQALADASGAAHPEEGSGEARAWQLLV